MGRPLYVCISGPDGSGKSTLCERLMRRFGAEGRYRAQEVTIWDMLYEPGYQDKVGFRSPKEVDAYLALLSPTARTLYLFHCLAQAMEIAATKAADILLLNSYWYKYYATEIAHGGDPEILRPLTAVFPEPDLTWYLRVSTDETYRRKEKISGYESGFSPTRSQEDFAAFQHKAHRTLDELKKVLQWSELDGTRGIEDLTNELYIAICARLSTVNPA